MRVAGIRVGSALCCAATLLLALVAGCDQLSDVGKVKEAEPTAIATSIGEAFANDADGNMTMTVRAGADVVLSGKESQKGADDKGIPIINFDWQQSQADSVPVQLIYRTSNTVSFMAPQVTSDTTLHFTLTVSDAKGAGDYATATVVVKNVRDQDRFLQYPVGAPGAVFSVVLATQADIAPVLQAGATDYVTATVKVTRLLTFRDRDSDALSTAATFTRVPIGAATTISTGWTTRLGSSASCTSPVNPVVRLPIPHLNLDEALASLDDVNDPTLAAAKAQLLNLKTRYPGAVILSDVLEASDLSGAGLKLELQVDVTPAAGVAKPCLKDTNGSVINVDAGNIVLASPSSSVTVPVESASAQIGTPAIAGLWPVATPNRDSRESAQAYYKAIDPLGDKTTLNDWLATNGFNAALPGYGADAHAVYTNNYDLGFGRDMYLRYGACDAGAAALPLQSRVGKCDVAAVVLNYPNMEAAAKKLNSFAAVAMEYSKVGGAGKRFVKFYTFVPDTRDGVYKRALSLNFDRRGEQYMPQACVVCHGGTPGTYTPAPPGLGTYANGGDVKAAFLPWDLDSFLFSAGPNADPGFSRKARDATLRGLYTRAAQESQFKLLNVGAYLTMANGLDQANNDDHRFDLGRELVEKWYGGLAGGNLQNAGYDDSTVPDGWKNNLNANPVDSPDVYHNVFARNCRTCHVLHVPNSVDPRTATVKLDNIDVPACSTPAAVNSSVGISSQVPMGCYWEFAHAPNLLDRLGRAHMPLARRTMDRLWVGADGTLETSVGAQLATHLGKQVAEVAPGTPVAAIGLTQPITAGNTCVDSTFSRQSSTAYTARRNFWIGADGADSSFPALHAYVLTPPAGSAASLAGANGELASFQPDVPGTYVLSLDVGGAAQAAATVTVNNCAPTAPATANFGTTQGATLNITNPSVGLLSGAVDRDGDSMATASFDFSDAACYPTRFQSISLQPDGTFSYTHFGAVMPPFVPGEQDRFKVRITDPYGGVAFRCVTITINASPDTTAPSPAPVITSVTANVNGGGIPPSASLVWSASQDKDDNGNTRPLAGYELYRCTAANCSALSSFVLVKTVAGTSTEDTSAPSNTFVTYRIAAVDTGSNPANGGGPNRAYSAGASVTTDVSFANNIHPMLSQCAGCHTSGVGAVGYWQYSSTVSDTWTSVSPWATKNVSGAAASGSAAALYVNPCGTSTTHTAANPNQRLGAQCSVLLNWIDRGNARN